MNLKQYIRLRRGQAVIRSDAVAKLFNRPQAGIETSIARRIAKDPGLIRGRAPVYEEFRYLSGRVMLPGYYINAFGAYELISAFRTTKVANEDRIFAQLINEMENYGLEGK